MRKKANQEPYNKILISLVCLVRIGNYLPDGPRAWLISIIIYSQKGEILYKFGMG